MKKVTLDKVEHLVSTNRSGKGNNKRYAFNDFSELIDVRDTMRKNEPKQKKRKKVKSNKIVKVVPFSGTMRITHTHIFIPLDESKECPGFVEKVEDGVIERWSMDNHGGEIGMWIIVNRYLTPNRVRTMYPNVLELMWSIDQEVFGDRMVFQNTK